MYTGVDRGSTVVALSMLLLAKQEREARGLRRTNRCAVEGIDEASLAEACFLLHESHP